MTLAIDNYNLEYEGQKLFLPLKQLMKKEPHQIEAYHPQGIYLRNQMVNKIKNLNLGSTETDEALRKLDKRYFTYKYFRDDLGEPMELRDYQVGMANSWAPELICQSSRATGKTTLMEVEALWGAETLPGFQTLIATQGESQLFPVMERIIRRINDHPELRASLRKKPVRQPKYCIEFKNGHILWGSIAGPDGTNFNGMHVHRILVDEAQIMTKKAWTELWRCRNEGQLTTTRIMGVPNGLRDRKFYELSNDRKHYEWFHYSQCLLPESSLETILRGAREYSDIAYPDFNNPDFLQQFLGLHAVPSKTGIDYDAYLKTTKPGFYSILNVPRSVFPNIITDDNDRCHSAFKDYASEQLKAIRNYINSESITTLYAGADLGYAADPTEIVIYYDHPGTGRLTALARFHFERIDYPIQCAVIEYFLETFPIARMGIDMGNNGLAVHQFMLARNTSYAERLKGYFFNQKMIVGYSADGEPQQRQMKEFSTSKINALCVSNMIEYREDRFRGDQYSNVVYRITQAGNIVFPSGNDHILDADRCMVTAWHCYKEHLEDDGGTLGSVDGIFLQGLKHKAGINTSPNRGSGFNVKNLGIL